MGAGLVAQLGNIRGGFGTRDIQVQHEAAERYADGMVGQGEPIRLLEDGQMPYEAFQVRHVEYCPEYWAILRALYSGGSDLLHTGVLERILIRNNAESQESYEARCRSAFYVPYPAEIIDYIVSNLAQDPACLLIDGEEPTGWWREFQSDTSAPGGEERDLNALIRQIVLEALQVKTAWVHLELPVRPDDEILQGMSLAEQDEAGLRRVHATVLPREKVCNWQENEEGDLDWALVRRVKCWREEFWTPLMITETYTRYRRADFSRWAITYKAGDPPDARAPMTELVRDEPHSCRRVPLLRYTLPDGLWAMDKLESLARAHLNKRNTLDWAERRALLPVLYEFLGAEGRKPGGRSISIAQQDPRRAVNTPRGHSTVQQRGGDDDARYVGPSAEPFRYALESSKELRSDMHRVMHQMSLDVEVNSSALRRSGQSKQEDRHAPEVVLGALADRMIEFVTRLARAAHASREENPPDVEVAVKGLRKFDLKSAAEIISQQAELEAIDIPSPTARIHLLMRVLRQVLDELDQDELAKIERELKEAITAESLQPGGAVDALLAEAQRRTNQIPDGGEPPAPDATEPPAR